jgi:multidrug resistance efflux pump
LQIEKAESTLDNVGKTLQNLLDIKNNPQEINAAVDQAYNAYQTAIAVVEAAERQVEQAKTSLEIIKVQLDKLISSSPISGVVAARYAEVGEIAKPGVPILTITELEEVTLTTYVPESKIGRLKLGQEAFVTVDSYPEESFSGKVVYISPRAVFTPKNIQLKDEREKMVFAVKIRLANPEQKLKPGMPADARLLINAGG